MVSWLRSRYPRVVNIRLSDSCCHFHFHPGRFRRAILRLFVAVVFCSAFHTATARSNQPPNIVYIIADDHAWTDFGFMGNERVHTPHLDALASKSARFVNGSVPSSVCRPSLVTLLTGLYPHEHGVHFNHGPPGNAGYNRMRSRAQYESIRRREFEQIRMQSTLPGLLHTKQGYRCLQTGKFWEGHWRNGGFTEGMTTFEPPPASQRFGGVRTLADGSRVAHGNGDVGLQIGRQTMSPIFEFIDSCEADATPWMVWYAPYLPHQPHDSPAVFFDMARKRSGVAEHELPYMASIAQFDDTVGRLVRFVEEKNAASRTVFVFVSDNGWVPSRQRARSRPEEFVHTKRSKRAPFDEGLRTPILIRWDGVTKVHTHEEPVSSIDLMPTLLDAAGISVESLSSAHSARTELSGISLLPAARGLATLDAQRPVFGEIYPGDASSLGHPERDIAYRWVRMNGMKLIVPHVHDGQELPWGGYLRKTALFNVAADPQESRDLANLPAHAGDVRRLKELLDNWWTP